MQRRDAFGNWAPTIAYSDYSDALEFNVQGNETYFRTLQIRLRFYLDQPAHLSRVAELCGKTNQFNLNLARLPEADLAGCMGSTDSCVVSTHLSDRLSDSGIVAAMVVNREGAELAVTELCISCRALGRKIEDTLVEEGLRLAREKLGVGRAAFHWRRGPRNAPARDWLAHTCGAIINGNAGRIAGPPEFGTGSQVPAGIQIVKKRA